MLKKAVQNVLLELTNIRKDAVEENMEE